MQATPIALLIAAYSFELIAAIAGDTTNLELLPELGKWTTLISAILSFLAIILSALLLIFKQFSSILIGFSITLLSAVTFAVFATWTASWWIMT